jgi:hypothetical protein
MDARGDPWELLQSHSHQDLTQQNVELGHGKTWMFIFLLLIGKKSEHLGFLLEKENSLNRCKQTITVGEIIIPKVKTSP